MQTNKFYTRKYFPFKLLCYLLYSDSPGNGIFERRDDGTVVLKTGPLSRALKTTPGRLGEHLRFLEEQGFIAELDRKRQGLMSARLIPPLGMGMY